jgi:hypothetical protein
MIEIESSTIKKTHDDYLKIDPKNRRWMCIFIPTDGVTFKFTRKKKHLTT